MSECTCKIVDVFSDEHEEVGQEIETCSSCTHILKVWPKAVSGLRSYDSAVTEIMESDFPSSTDWANLRATRQVGRNLIAECEKEVE